MVGGEPAAGELHRGTAGRLAGAQPVGMNRRDRGGAGQDHAERLGDRGHRARGSHHGTGAGGRREVALDLVDLVGSDLAGAVPRPKAAAIGAGAEALAMPARGHHRPGDELDRRPVRGNRAHQLRRHGLVAAADQHHRIHRLGADHLLGVDRHQVAKHQARRVEKDLAERNRRKGQWQPAHRQDTALDRLDQLGEMAMAIVVAGIGVGDADHRPRQHVARIAHRAGKGTPQIEREIGVAVIGEPARQARGADRLVHAVLSSKMVRQLAAGVPPQARAASRQAVGAGAGRPFWLRLSAGDDAAAGGRFERLQIGLVGQPLGLAGRYFCRVFRQTRFVGGFRPLHIVPGLHPDGNTASRQRHRHREQKAELLHR